MSRRRKLSPGYWVAFAALAVAGVLIAWSILTGLVYPGLMLASSSITVLTSLWLMRLSWKQLDPLDPRSEKRNLDQDSSASSE